MQTTPRASTVAAASGRYSASQAAQVCTTCKIRKKKCDKTLPHCGYCVRKGLSCQYGKKAQRKSSGIPSATPPLVPLVLPQEIPSEVSASAAGLYAHVLGLIGDTGQFVDDITTRYFRGLHRYLPFISRRRFHRSFITLGAIPSAGFSVLLLALCLTTSSPRLDDGSGHASDTQRSLYLATKSLLAQVQGSFPSAIQVIQARLLISLYEYTHGRPDEAFESIAGCARMAYAARIHLSCTGHQRGAPCSPDTNADIDLQLQAKEAANTWWGIVTCERMFICEVSVPEQPLISVIPNGAARLPSERGILDQSNFPDTDSIPDVAVSCLSSANVGAFGRTAQAAWLLGQVFKGFEISDLDTRLVQLQELDSTIQKFLGGLMQQCCGNGMEFCEAVSMAIRSLFTLNQHIPVQNTQTSTASYHSMIAWRKRSHAALDTVTKMMLDVVETHVREKLNPDPCPPSFSYNVRAALKHIRDTPDWKSDPWRRGAEERFRVALDHIDSTR